MNRIQLLDHQSSLARQPTASSRRRKLVKSGSAGLTEQSFFVPLHYEPNYAYPLVVWLHGPEGDHTQLKRVMPHISVRNYVAVAPASPGDHEGAAEPAANPWPQHEVGIAASLDRVEEAIEQAASRFHIARHRVFLAGFDGGGTMALRLGMVAPKRLAGAASLGGPFPHTGQPLANLLRARQLQMLISHGRDSDVYPIRRVCEELRLFHVAGLSLNLRQYPCGHELTTQMLSDLDVWMMEIVTGTNRSRSAPASPQLPRDELN
jgi:phospholipase/carboxylesterase